jgi:hypothetical protein
MRDGGGDGRLSGHRRSLDQESVMFPKKDAALVPYTNNWKTRITATPATWNFSASDASAYGALSDTYTAAQAAYATAVAAGIRDKSLLDARNDAKKALLAKGREMYALVQNSSTISDANKALLNVTVKKTAPSPSPIPATAPKLTIGTVRGTSVDVFVQDGSVEGKRRRLPLTEGAAVVSYIGDAPPADPADFVLEGVTGKTKFTVNFPAATSPGTKVWLAAYWFNGAKKSGPTCMPQWTRLQGMTTVAEEGEGSEAA